MEGEQQLDPCLSATTLGAFFPARSFQQRGGVRWTGAGMPPGNTEMRAPYRNLQPEQEHLVTWQNRREATQLARWLEVGAGCSQSVLNCTAFYMCMGWANVLPAPFMRFIASPPPTPFPSTHIKHLCAPIPTYHNHPQPQPPTHPNTHPITIV
jgi:hypothetical protein